MQLYVRRRPSGARGSTALDGPYDGRCGAERPSRGGGGRGAAPEQHGVRGGAAAAARCGGDAAHRGRDALRAPARPARRRRPLRRASLCRDLARRHAITLPHGFPGEAGAATHGHVVSGATSEIAHAHVAPAVSLMTQKRAGGRGRIGSEAEYRNDYAAPTLRSPRCHQERTRARERATRKKYATHPPGPRPPESLNLVCEPPHRVRSVVCGEVYLASQAPHMCTEACIVPKCVPVRYGVAGAHVVPQERRVSIWLLATSTRSRGIRR
mmetsp:Transcript_23778/g.76248  ORF Transcript_23778/g.76248 Transcript_23778/m.76248 type:complete len:268 (+) Transcript_23778:334-1137(+)